jgi:hypothetical protein
MKWEEVGENRQLQDLPFKIELNNWGQIVMSPLVTLGVKWNSRKSFILKPNLLKYDCVMSKVK